MECGLGCQDDWYSSVNQEGVFILVVMEDAFRLAWESELIPILCLNPCFNGSWSRTAGEDPVIQLEQLS